MRNVNSGVEYAKKADWNAIKKILLLILAALVIVILVFSSTYQISEQEQAVLTTFGKAKAVTTSGLHFKIPFIQNVKKVNTTIQGFTIGYDKDTEETIESEAIMNLVNVDIAEVDDSIKDEKNNLKFVYTGGLHSNRWESLSYFENRSCSRGLF